MPRDKNGKIFPDDPGVEAQAAIQQLTDPGLERVAVEWNQSTDDTPVPRGRDRQR